MSGCIEPSRLRWPSSLGDRAEVMAMNNADMSLRNDGHQLSSSRCKPVVDRVSSGLSAPLSIKSCCRLADGMIRFTPAWPSMVPTQVVKPTVEVSRSADQPDRNPSAKVKLFRPWLNEESEPPKEDTSPGRNGCSQKHQMIGIQWSGSSDAPAPVNSSALLSALPVPTAIYQLGAVGLHDDLSNNTMELVATTLGRTASGHRCVYCGKLYSRKYGLKIHLRTHTGFKPLRCKVCQRAFGDPSNLNKHTRLHMVHRSNPFTRKCPMCDKTLMRKRDLNRHIASRHANCKTETSE